MKLILYIIIDGTLALQISSETVPDFATAKIEFNKISDLISLSETTSYFLNENYLTFYL